jgi:hypothetical protein
MEQLGSHSTDFREFSLWIIVTKSAERIQISLKSDKNNGTLHEDLRTFMIIYRSFLLRMRNVSGKICRENQNTHFMFNNFFFRKSCHLCDLEKYGTARQATDDNITQRMRFACLIAKATDTYPEYVIFNAFPLQQLLRERASMLHLYMYIACAVFRVSALSV